MAEVTSGSLTAIALNQDEVAALACALNMLCTDDVLPAELLELHEVVGGCDEPCVNETSAKEDRRNDRTIGSWCPYGCGYWDEPDAIVDHVQYGDCPRANEVRA